uniref:Uncharacterized protein n=1 Tax=Globisporangium ultimum (strain ATCC 200006 / CBS 805.95 / DAOM BR144) TaxID=431595 RepID=K3WYE8_GLOUD
MSQFINQLKSKMKMVAARASDALAQAADIVAPTLYESRAEEFHHRWQTVSHFLESIMNRDLDPAEQRRLLLESHTRDSLQKMVLLIYAEENALDRLELSATNAGNVSPQSDVDAQQQQPRECLEYLLERQIIPHLCDAGKRDQPFGIMSLSMQFVGALLSRVNYPLLPTREVHVSVVGLIEAATKKEKLRADPVQTEFFFLHADSMIIRKSGSGGTSDYSLHASSQTHDISELVLFTGLLPHMYAMGKVGEKCREALVIAAAVHEKALCRFVLQLTPFCHYAVNGVISAFDNLPKTLPDGSTRGGAVLSPRSGSMGIDNELYLIAIRLRFCCTLAMVARFELTETDEETGEEVQTSIANELLLQFRSRFLEGPLLEGLLNTSESTARTATLYARIILEEIVSCCSDTSASPLLFVYVQFLLQQTPMKGRPIVTQEVSPPKNASESKTQVKKELSSADPAITHILPSELLHRMDSLSSSLSIATIDLFTYLMELQDEHADLTLLGGLEEVELMVRHRSSSALSPTHANGAVWFASRFPNSAVASNAHLWKIQAFDGISDELDIPAADDSEEQVLSLLSYIADAEYAACQRVSVSHEESDTSDDESAAEEEDASTPAEAKSISESGGSPEKFVEGHAKTDKKSAAGSATSRTAATRNSMKPLREVNLTLNLPSFSPVTPAFQRQKSFSSSQPKKSSSFSRENGELPLFIRVVFNRLERILENSFQENLALSGLIAAIAQKTICASVVFDIAEQRPAGQSVRSILEDVYADALRRIDRLSNGEAKLLEIRKRLVEDDNEASLNDHEAETRLLCGFIVLEEILKELCSVLFAKERVRNLPVKPEGYYLGPKRTSSSVSRKISTDTNYSDTGSSCGLFSPTSSENADGSTRGFGEDGELVSPKKKISIGREFEQLLAEAESSIESILLSDRAQAGGTASEADVDAAIASTDFSE